MYRKGDVRIEIANKKQYWYNDADGNTVRYNPPREKPREEWYVSINLPHSCDEWEIGGPEEARQLIRDLEDAIVEYERI